MTQRVYRVRQLASGPHRPGILPVSQATLWRWVRAGKFPRPFKLSVGVTVWDADEVDQFITAQRESRDGSHVA